MLKDELKNAEVYRARTFASLTGKKEIIDITQPCKNNSEDVGDARSLLEPFSFRLSDPCLYENKDKEQGNGNVEFVPLDDSSNPYFVKKVFLQAKGPSNRMSDTVVSNKYVGRKI